MDHEVKDNIYNLFNHMENNVIECINLHIEYVLTYLREIVKYN